MSAIDDKYTQLGGASGFLGQPQSPEQDCSDHRGRFRRFQGGSIYWSPQTNAHEVHGAIRDKWVALGSERSPLGYPLSDETPRPEAGGRYNNFQFGFISWTAPTGAHAVYDDYKAYLDRLENSDRGSACEQRGPRHSWHAQAAITVFWYRLKWELSPTSTEL